MDLLLIVVIVLVLGVAGGAGLLLARDPRWRPGIGLPARASPRLPSATTRPGREIVASAATPSSASALDSAPASSEGRSAVVSVGGGGPRQNGSAVAAPAERDLPPELARLRDELRADLGLGESPVWSELRIALGNQDARMAKLEARVAEDGERLAAGLAALDREGRARQEAAERRWREADAHQDAALAALQGRLLAAIREQEQARARAATGAAKEWLGQRRAEVAADLYARLARLEAAVAAVTNPILLPGEPYAPPADLLPDALNWENWKEVGERAFAFADAFSSQRIFLEEEARITVARFVTALRGLLTQEIYPNLRPDPTPAQADALIGALSTLGEAIPGVRLLLERSTRPPEAGSPPA